MKKIKHFINDFVSNRKKNVALATILAVVGVGDVLGQTSPWVVTDGPNWGNAVREMTVFNQSTPNMTMGAGVFAKLSVSEMMRISPFVKIGSKVKSSQGELSLRYITEANHLVGGADGVRPAHGWQPAMDLLFDFYSNSGAMNFFVAGADFRITNNNLIRVSGGTEGWYGGFIRRQPLSRTMSMDFEAGFGTGRRSVFVMGEAGEGHHPGSSRMSMSKSSNIQELSGGIRIRKNVWSNINIEAGVSFARNIRYENTSSIGDQINEERRQGGMPTDIPIPTPDRTTPLNSLNFSIGIHKKFRVGNVPQVTLERRQRQPRRTAITCPHMQPRPWETVQPFNHPIAR